MEKKKHIPAAFMSYVRFEDEHNNGRLTEFQKNLSAEVRVQTGEPFLIFQDRQDIEWGQNWRERIIQSLNEVTFLIPIITPSYFMSLACRSELEMFLEREKQLGRNDLILPLYYVDTPLLNDEMRRSQDPLAQAIASRQFADWRDLRFEPFSSTLVGKTLAKLAVQIRNTLERTVTPESLNVNQTEGSLGSKLDDIAEGSKGIFEANRAVKELLSILSRVGPLVTKWITKVNEQIERFNSATTPAQEKKSESLLSSYLRNGAKDFEQILPILDAAVITWIEFISFYIGRRDSKNAKDREELSFFREQISSIFEGVQPLLEVLRVRSNNVLKLGDVSAEVDKASRRMAKALNSALTSFEQLNDACSKALQDIDEKVRT